MQHKHFFRLSGYELEKFIAREAASLNYWRGAPAYPLDEQLRNLLERYESACRKEAKLRREKSEMVFDEKIKISGPGGVINNLLSVIRKALEHYGWEVQVTNAYPEGEPDLEYLKTLKGKKVSIEMNHLPWGG